MIRNRIRLIFLKILPLIVGLSVTPASFGQHVSVSATLDSTLMFIGGQMNMMLEVVQPAGLQVVMPNFNDTITKNIEVIYSTNPDTVRNGDILSISRLYRITSFDSGLHYIPPIEIEYRAGELIEKQESRSLALMVINPFVEVDPEKGIFDIKQPINLPFSLMELLKYLKWVILFMLVSSLLVLAIHWFLKKRNPIKEILFKEKPKELPHVIALRELDRIKNEKVWQKGQVKHFYSQLSDTLRVYMEERFQFSAMERTTPEILKMLKTIDLPDDKLYSKVVQMLETADLAKFAKYEPLPDENDVNLIGAYFFVNQTKVEELKTPEEAASESLEKENKNVAVQHQK